MDLSSPTQDTLDALMTDADGPCRTLLAKVFSALEDGRQDYALAAWCKVHALLREGAGAHDAALTLRAAAERLSAAQAERLAASA